MSWGWLRIAPLHREETVSDDVTFAKGLRCNGKTGVNTTLKAVLELYAGKLARTVTRGPRFREGTWLPSLLSSPVSGRRYGRGVLPITRCARSFRPMRFHESPNVFLR